MPKKSASSMPSASSSSSSSVTPYRRRYYKKRNVSDGYARHSPSNIAVFQGRGEYRTLLNRIKKDIESPSCKGESFLGKVGKTAGNALSHFFGLGAYSVKQNTLLQDPLPVINKAHREGVTISHREYICDIITGAANTFNLQAFPVNPGQESTFPWLSQVAANYTQYRLDGMLFEYRSMSADALNSTNTALGQVIMATQYDAALPNFSQKSEMENYFCGQSCRPSESAIHPIECARNQSTLENLYTRVGSVPTGDDIRFYDMGTFQIATNGFQGANVNVGELWVTYQVTLFKEQMYSSLGNYNNVSILDGSFSSATGTCNAATPLAGLGAKLLLANDPSYRVNTLGVITNMKPGAGYYNGGIIIPATSIIQTYCVVIKWLGSGAFTAPTVTVNGFNWQNLRLGGNYNNGNFGTIPASGAAGVDRFTINFGVQSIPNLPTYLEMGIVGTGPANCFCYVDIYQIPNLSN
jgi:hypothetical protein